MNFESLIEHLVPSLDHVRASVAAMKAKHPELGPRELAHRAIHQAKLKAATTGAVTGAASSPLTMIPAALADMAAVLTVEGLMVAEIGLHLCPDQLTDANAIKADIISIIFPAAASQALRQFGIRAGERLTQSLLRKYATEDMVRLITRYSAGYLSKQLMRETILTKAVPLVGVGIGAGWNWLEVGVIGNRAIQYYSDEAIGPSLTSTVQESAGKVWKKMRNMLPGKST